MKNVACFLTGGYTESGEMQHFLKKINDSCSFHQCFPNKVKKRKGQVIPLNNDVNGLTGEQLIDRAVEIISAHPEYEKYDAVLIEDDLDLRFKDKNEEEIKKYTVRFVIGFMKRLGR